MNFDVTATADRRANSATYTITRPLELSDERPRAWAFVQTIKLNDVYGSQRRLRSQSLRSWRFCGGTLSTFSKEQRAAECYPSLVRSRPAHSWCFRAPERRRQKRHRRRISRKPVDHLRVARPVPLPRDIFEAAVTALVRMLRAELQTRP